MKSIPTMSRPSTNMGTCRGSSAGSMQPSQCGQSPYTQTQTLHQIMLTAWCCWSNLLPSNPSSSSQFNENYQGSHYHPPTHTNKHAHNTHTHTHTHAHTHTHTHTWTNTSCAVCSAASSHPSSSSIKAFHCAYPSRDWPNTKATNANCSSPRRPSHLPP